MITGDGDGLSIGGNHFLHGLRRNLDINIILFNNRIYGLTKGQYSPTSEFGKRTKSSPQGTIEHPIRPVRAAIAAEATWVARSVDADAKHLAKMLKAMADHDGVSFLEVYQNCIIFNDKAFEDFAAKKVRDERMVYLEHGQPLRFGKDKEWGIRLDGLTPHKVKIGEGGVTEDDLLVPVGVFLDVQRDIYEQSLEAQVAAAKSEPGAGDINALLAGSNTWTVD